MCAFHLHVIYFIFIFEDCNHKSKLLFCEYDNKHQLYITQRDESRINLYTYSIRKSTRHNRIYLSGTFLKYSIYKQDLFLCYSISFIIFLFYILNAKLISHIRSVVGNLASSQVEYVHARKCYGESSSLLQ